METFAVYWEPIIKTYGIVVAHRAVLDLPGSALRPIARRGGFLSEPCIPVRRFADTDFFRTGIILRHSPESASGSRSRKKTSGLETGEAIEEKVQQAKSPLKRIMPALTRAVPGCGLTTRWNWFIFRARITATAMALPARPCNGSGAARSAGSGGCLHRGIGISDYSQRNGMCGPECALKGIQYSRNR